MAVYTEVSDDELAEFIASYDLGALLSYKGIAEGVENTNYLVHTEKGPFFLTLYEKRVAPRRSALLPRPDGASGRSAGITCPTPVRDAQGPHAARACRASPAALVTFLEGVWIRRPQPRHCAARWAGAWPRCIWRGQSFRLQPRQCARAFRLAAALSSASPPRRRDRAGSRRHHRAGARSPGSQLAGRPAAGRHPRRSLSRQRLLPRRRSSGLIDFYFACNDALAYDVAVALNAWCFESDHAFNITKGQALLKGYQSVRPLTPAEREALPLLARGAALRFLLTRAYDWLHTPRGCARQPQGPAGIPAPAAVPPRRPLGQPTTASRTPVR